MLTIFLNRFRGVEADLALRILIPPPLPNLPRYTYLPTHQRDTMHSECLKSEHIPQYLLMLVHEQWYQDDMPASQARSEAFSAQHSETSNHGRYAVVSSLRPNPLAVPLRWLVLHWRTRPGYCFMTVLMITNKLSCVPLPRV